MVVREASTQAGPAQCRAARALVNLSQATLAKMAGLGVSTVADFELERPMVSPEAADRLQAALEAAGVEFTNGKKAGGADELNLTGWVLTVLKSDNGARLHY